MNPMSPLRAAVLILLISIAFVVIILLCSRMMTDSPKRETGVFLLIAIWWVPYSYFCVRLGTRCKTSCKT